MSQPGGEPRDPFRTDGNPPPGPAPTSQPQRPDQPAPDSPDARRTAIRLAVVSIAAVGAAFFAPPVGVVLGIVAIVLGLRTKHVVPTRPRVLALVSGSMALVVGVVITSAALVFRAEITQYSRCIQGANTVQAQQNCQDELNESLSSRIGL